MGSKQIWKLKYSQGFVFIGKIGSTTCNEARASEKAELVQVTQIFQVNAAGGLEGDVVSERPVPAEEAEPVAAKEKREARDCLRSRSSSPSGSDDESPENGEGEFRTYEE